MGYVVILMSFQTIYSINYDFMDPIYYSEGLPRCVCVCINV
jgi:hypothetical protein